MRKIAREEAERECINYLQAHLDASHRPILEKLAALESRSREPRSNKIGGSQAGKASAFDADIAGSSPAHRTTAPSSSAAGDETPHDRYERALAETRQRSHGKYWNRPMMDEAAFGEAVTDAEARGYQWGLARGRAERGEPCSDCAKWANAVRDAFICDGDAPVQPSDVAKLVRAVMFETRRGQAERGEPGDAGVLGLIASERARQTSREGYTLAHDDEHDEGELACAAACYAIPDCGEDRAHALDALWPWDDGDFKPTPNDRIRELVKAGALIVAEIERLQRALASDAAAGSGKEGADAR